MSFRLARPLLVAALALALYVCGSTPAALFGDVIPMDIKSCPSTPDIMQLNNFSTYRIGNSFLASLIIDVPRAVAYFSKMALKLTQCPTGAPCKQFYTLRYSSGVCNLLKDRNAFWGPAFTDAEPPMRCPLEKRVYILRNATLSVEKFAILFRAISPTALREALWSSKLEVWDEKDKLLVCAIIKVKYLERKQ
ncbi:uncharacterized protein LOC113216078 [Frankliniella occidentalis]|uniref:Uncharacterized protein LOC113216078 n=1 Tax=Frankliniella occidentalis TaxID=133901 RepID=A0A6J1TFP1_FRAOC|nr:uncharacterized protein LOC113216078 [Frankliniella occidentalis]XP_052121057.1 uncharacterized protein LOC113216078 [Frankliniella occidentalis]